MVPDGTSGRDSGRWCARWAVGHESTRRRKPHPGLASRCELRRASVRRVAVVSGRQPRGFLRHGEGRLMPSHQVPPFRPPVVEATVRTPLSEFIRGLDRLQAKLTPQGGGGFTVDSRGITAVRAAPGGYMRLGLFYARDIATARRLFALLRGRPPKPHLKYRDVFGAKP